MTGAMLTGRVAIVTGASRGLGLAIARAYLEHGASVVACARNGERLARARGEIESAMPDAAERLHMLTVDMCEPSAIEALVGGTRERFGDADVVVNNAAIQGPIGPTDGVDWEAWTRTIEINLVGSAALFRAVLPAMRARRRGKIIQLSGGGAANGRPNFSAYAVSKAAVVRLVETVALEVRELGIDVNAMAPGALDTEMLDEIIAAGAGGAGESDHSQAMRVRGSGASTLAPAVELALFLASAASDGISGRLIHAVWDNWRAWPRHLDELAKSDAYTLRRIVGRDRGLEWGDL